MTTPMAEALSEAIAARLPELQAAAESLMVETCRIDRVTGRGEDDFGRDTVTYLDPPVYVGKCKIQTWQAYESTPEVGQSTMVTQRYYVHVPVSAARVDSGDMITITTPGRAQERVFRVAGEHDKTLQTARRLLVDEQTGGVGSSANAD